MSDTQSSLAEGLRIVLYASTTSSPVLTPSTSSLMDAAVTSLMPGPEHGGNGSDGGQDMHEWSSLIGISTALVGNVLISLALNIQRYAHIRIEREWALERMRERTNWKHANSIPSAEDSGSSTSDCSYEPAGRKLSRHSDIKRYRDESPDIEHALDKGLASRAGQDINIRNGGPTANDPLCQSILSDGTVRPGDDDLEQRYGRRKSYLRSPYWWAGITLMCLGEVGNFLAYGFAPASIVSPLGVVAMISNCVIAPFMLKEKFRKRDLWGVLIAIAGAVVVVLSAKSAEEKIGPHEIWIMITQWEFELYLAVSAAMIISLMWVSGKHGSRSIFIDVGLVALFGGYTALSTKGVSSILSFTLWHIITFPVSYLLGFVLVASALMQIRYINRALQRFDSTQVIPTQFVLFTLSVIIGSAVLYRDFDSFTPARTGKFVGGCLLTFLGVYFITSGRARADGGPACSEEDEEEVIGLLAGNRYQDNVDTPTSRTRGRGYRQTQKHSGVYHDEGLLPSGSLLCDNIEVEANGQLTPREAVSGIPPSPHGSSATESLRSPSAEHSPQLPPSSISLTTNPWAESLEQFIYTSEPEDPITRPITPRDQSGNIAHTSGILLRFPSAPDASDTPPQQSEEASSSVQGLLDTGRATPIAHMPSPRSVRDSISKRFSPGPLLPTLSGGFSAVVAESLRRDESNPLRNQTPKRHTSRKKRMSTSVADGILRSEVGDIDAAVDDGLEHSSTAQFPQRGDIPHATAAAVQLSSALAVSAGSSDSNARDDATSLKRLRSFSDSWGAGIHWLGGSLNKLRRRSGEPPAEHAQTAGRLESAIQVSGTTDDASSG